MNVKSAIDAERGTGFTTSAPEIVPVLAQYKIEPNEFLPMPRPGETCPFSGLRRGTLYALWHAGEIETVSVRRRGKTRGRRLIVACSLRDYLRRLRQEQCASEQTKGSAA
jgi:hypothetical protein